MPTAELSLYKPINNSMTRFSTYYKHIVCPDLLLKLPISNINELPKFDKLVLHASSSSIVQDKKQVLPALMAFEYLTGQKATVTWSRKSVAAFRLRKNSVIGCRVTLRRDVLFTFFEKYALFYLPRLYDWQIVSASEKVKSLEINRGYRDPFLFFELEPLTDVLQGFQGFQLNWNIKIKKTLPLKQVRYLLFSAFQGI